MDIKAIKKLAAEAAKLENHNLTKKGGDFERVLPPAGKTVGRFIEYIETGMHPQTYNNKPKEPAEEARLVFELLSPKNIREIGEGKDKTKIADKISINVTKGFYEKSKYKKIYDMMRYGRDDISHIVQMLGEAFIFTIKHNASKKDATKIFANIDSIESPFVVDPITDTTTPVPVPSALSPMRLFLWDMPNAEQWESLHIEGTRTVKNPDGTEEEVSKNWIQSKLLSAVNFEGSPLNEMLTEAGVDLSVIGTTEAPTEEVAEEAEAPKPVAAKSKTTTKASAPAKTSQTAKSVTTASPSKAVPKATPAPAKTTTVAQPKKAAAVAKAEAVDPLTALGLN